MALQTILHAISVLALGSKVVFVGELAFTSMFCLTVTGRRRYIIYSITVRKEMVWSWTEYTGLSWRRLVGQPSPPSFSVVSFEQALSTHA